MSPPKYRIVVSNMLQHVNRGLKPLGRLGHLPDRVGCVRPCEVNVLCEIERFVEEVLGNQSNGVGHDKRDKATIDNYCQAHDILRS
jgi:hypothetical protein